VDEIILAALMMVYMKWIILAGLFAISVRCFVRYAKWQIARNDLRAAECEATAARADEQNAYYSEGDPIGTYGEYDAYTMPLDEPREWYDYK
jgi:hypothetical protein